MTTDELDLEELEKIAKAATPGPWRYDGLEIAQLTDGGEGYPLDRYPDSKTVLEAGVDDFGNNVYPVIREEDGHHIARCDPPTVLALLRRVREAEAERDHWRDEHRARASEVDQLKRLCAELRTQLAEGQAKMSEPDRTGDECFTGGCRNRLPYGANMAYCPDCVNGEGPASAREVELLRSAWRCLDTWAKTTGLMRWNGGDVILMDRYEKLDAALDAHRKERSNAE